MSNKIKILFVEDLQTDAEMARRALKKEKIDFTDQVIDNETDYKKALEKFNPDIVISDYSMPSFDGMSALKILMSAGKNIPFIMLTGSM
ncbi:MAG: response regulator, partial [Atribacterota bacterium]|nr:response regulator [Atribacterota bacterium]